MANPLRQHDSHVRAHARHLGYVQWVARQALAQPAGATVFTPDSTQPVGGQALETHAITTTPPTPARGTGCVVGRVSNARPDSGTHLNSRGSSMIGGSGHPAWAAREVARNLAQPLPSQGVAPLTRAEKRRARSRARAARHRRLGGTR